MIRKNKSILMFMCFLGRHKATKNYIKNVHKGEVLVQSRRDLKGRLLRNYESSFISGAFAWEGSPQGYEYWRSLALKWQNFIEYENNKNKISAKH